MEYYTAWLELIVLVNDKRSRNTHTHNDSVFLFKARDFDHAFQLALKLGKKEETTYKNKYGHSVRWALVRVKTLECVGPSVEGKEVAWSLSRKRSKKPIPFRTRFKPEKAKPMLSSGS